METEGVGVRSILVRVGPDLERVQQPDAARPAARDPRELEALGRPAGSLHAMPSESVARAIVRAVAAPVEESYTTVVEVQPGEAGSKEDAK